LMPAPQRAFTPRKSRAPVPPNGLGWVGALALLGLRTSQALSAHPPGKKASLFSSNPRVLSRCLLSQAAGLRDLRALGRVPAAFPIAGCRPVWPSVRLSRALS
jgi:hypothetical protein